MFGWFRKPETKLEKKLDKILVEFDIWKTVFEKNFLPKHAIGSNF
jgi:hypothetical protein